MATNIDKVQQLYVAYFNRPADVAGLNFWVGALAKGVTVDTIAASFATQAEYKALFAGKGAESIINTVYLNMFGRNAEKAALDFYGPLVQNGTISIDKVVTDIVKGAQGTDATAYNNKVTAAKAFTAALDTAGNEADRIAYATGTDAVLSIAKTWLATVTTDASLTTALAAVEATVDSMGGLGNVGQTFTMTQGLDTILGTAADDTINAFAFNGTTGTNVTTLNSVDTVDGGTGVDSLFIEVKDSDATAGNASASLNGTIVGTFKNIEKITIDNTGVDSATAVAAVDASKFVGATNITQVSRAGAVTSLASSTTATFKGVDANVAVTAANGTANIALDNLGEGRTITVDGSSVTTVVLTGTVKDTSGAGGTDAPIVALTVGKDQQTATLNTAVEAVLTVAQAAGSTKPLLTVDASASSAGVEYDATGTTSVTTIKGGAGNDTLTIATATLAAAGSTPATNALVEGGAGKDDITVKTTGTGATTVNGGAGNDTVTISAARSSGVLTVNLGDGNDVFTSSSAINATDVIDAGAGADKLLLNLVGSANVGAFSNFDSFDAIGLAKTLDVDILAAKNTVTEFVASGAVGAGLVTTATLTSIGAGVGFRATADIGTANTMVLTQKTGGAMTITLDADETGDADAAADSASAAVNATNATSLKAVFDTSYLATITGEATPDNVSTLALQGGAATSLEVVSGGALSNNVLTYADTVSGANTTAKLASITVTGDRALDLSFSFAATNNSLATVDASAHTGGLTFDLADLKNGGTVKLGSGADVIAVTVASTTAGIESISGFEKAAAASIGTDATAAAAAIDDADILSFAGAVADAVGGVFTNGTIAKGVLTFTGAGPATLNDAIAIANVAAETAGETVVFEYLGNSYVFSQVDGNAASVDIVVKLTGTTGITNFVEDGTTNTFFIV
jgi:hypothetical protein